MKLQLGIISLILLPFWSGVLGGQIPAFNGVFGGMSPLSEVASQQKVFKSVETTPGALRVVENSGICG